MKRKKKSGSKFKLLVFVLFLYVGGYAANSVFGGYWLSPELDAKMRAHSGIEKQTAIMWQPRFGYVSRAVTDYAGYAFWPLVKLDRRLVHPSHDLGEKDYFKWADALPVAKIHPALRADVLKGRSEAAKSRDL